MHRHLIPADVQGPRGRPRGRLGHRRSSFGQRALGKTYRPRPVRGHNSRRIRPLDGPRARHAACWALVTAQHHSAPSRSMSAHPSRTPLARGPGRRARGVDTARLSTGVGDPLPRPRVRSLRGRCGRRPPGIFPRPASPARAVAEPHGNVTQGRPAAAARLPPVRLPPGTRARTLGFVIEARKPTELGA